MNLFILKTLEHRVLPVPFYILTLWGVWCPENLESKFKRIYSIFTVAIIASEIVSTLESTIYLVISIRDRQFELDVFFITTSLMVGVYKALTIVLQRNRIAETLMNGFQDRWRKSRDGTEKQILDDFFSETWRIHVMYAVACCIGVGIKVVGPMMKLDSELALPTPAWYPYDLSKPLNFWLSYLQQIVIGGAIISMHIGADTMLSGLLLQSCVQMKLLKHRLKNFFHLCNERNGHRSATKVQIERALIRQYVYDHQFIYDFVDTVNDDFSGWLLSVLTVVVPNICINVYFLCFTEIGLNVDFITALGLFSISLFQIYLPCWYGNEITLQSMEIGDAVYEMDWVPLASNTKRALLIMMLRASKPIQLTAAKVVPIDVKSFLSIMKTSYSALSVLQQTKS